jgi:hypothetical protein
MGTIKTAIHARGELDNPNVVKVVTDVDDYALYFSRSPLPYHRDGAGEGAALGYKHIGLYVYRRDFLLAFARLEPTPLEQAEQLEQLRALERGYRIKVAEVDAASIEVDTAADSSARARWPRHPTSRTDDRGTAAEGGLMADAGANQVHLRHRRRGVVARQAWRRRSGALLEAGG